MKRIFLVSLFFILTTVTYAQVGIGTTNPDPSSILDLSSTNKGLLIPRVSLNKVTNKKLDGTNNAAPGLLIYNTNASVTSGNGIGLYYFNGTAWSAVTPSSGGGGGSGWNLDGNSVGNADFIGTTNRMPLKFKVLNGSFGQFEVEGGMSLGFGATSSGHRSIAFGNTATAHQDAIAIGTNAKTFDNESIAIGVDAKSKFRSLAIGKDANGSGNESIAIGFGATSNYQNIAIGLNAKASANDAVVIGSGAKGENQNTVVIGKSAAATTNDGIAIGFGASASGYQSMALGLNAKGLHQNSLALGKSSTTTQSNQIVLGSTSNTQVRAYGNLVVGGSNSYTLPASRGSSGQFLKLTDNNGTLGWATPTAPRPENTATIEDIQSIHALIAVQQTHIENQQREIEELREMLSQVLEVDRD